jgi:hypothetical protein
VAVNPELLRRLDPETQADIRQPTRYVNSARRVATVEKASAETLPTSLSLALAESSLDDEELDRAAREIARTFDVDPLWLLGDPYAQYLTYRDPVSGTVLSLSTARRLLQPYSEQSIKAMLGQATSAQLTPEQQRKFGEGGGLSSRAVARMMQALAPLAGEDMELTTALGAAVTMVRQGVDPTALEANLRVVESIGRWTEIQKLTVAHAAAMSRPGAPLRDRFDALRFAASTQEEAELIGQAEAAERVRQEQQGLPGPVIGRQALVGKHPEQELQIAGLGLAIAQNEGNYITEGKKLAESVRIAEQQWDRSFLGKTVNTVGYVFNRAVGTLDAATYLVLGSPSEYEATGIGEVVADRWDEAKDLFWGRDSLAEVWARDTGLPVWVTTLAVLGFQWYLGPDILIAKAIKNARYGRFLGTAKSAERWQQQALAWIDTPLRRVNVLPGAAGRLRPWEYLAREAVRGETEFFRATDHLTGYFGTRGIPDDVATTILDRAQEIKAAGGTVADVEQEVRALFVSAFTGRAPAVGEHIEMARRTWAWRNLREEQAARFLPYELADGSKYALTGDTKDQMDFLMAVGVMESGEREALAIRRALDVPAEDAIMGVLGGEMGVPAMLEIPHLTSRIRLPGAVRRGGLATGEQAAIVRSWFKGFPELRGGKLYIKIEENPVQQFEEALIRAQLPEKLVAQGRAEMGRAITSADREASFRRVIEKWEGQIKTEYAARWSLTEAQMDELISRMRTRFSWPSPEGQVYGALTSQQPGLAPFRGEILQPFLPSQLLNEWSMVDPVLLRRSIAEAVGTTRKWMRSMQRAMGEALPEAKLRRLTFRKAFDVVLDSVVKDAFLLLWKPLVVIRPAYVLRVVGVEEQARFLSTAGLAARLESGKVGGRVLARLDKLLGREPKMRWTVRLSDETEEVFEVARPGLLPNETLADNRTGSLVGAEDPFNRYLGRLSVKKWGAVGRDDPQFYDAWAHALKHQLAGDPLGSRYLRAVMEGKTPQQAIEDTFAFLQNDPRGKGLAQRLMGTDDFSEEALRQQVQYGVAITHQYTGGSRALAGAALERLETFDAKMLRNTFDDARPIFVHGPELELALARTGPLKRAAGHLANGILRMPTNALSRQPYFKHWYATTLKGLVQNAADSGVTLTDQTMRAFEAAAREFALSQVKRVLFDFTRQARFGEMFGWAIPFFQPFLEAFTVWGRIIRQNPAVVPYALRLYDAAVESGFVTTDPDTGERIIKTSNWLGLVPLGVALGVLPTEGGPLSSGWSLSAPLSSFNFFFQSAFPLPIGGGARIPVPAPGLGPHTLWALQRLLSSEGAGGKLPDWLRNRMTSWAFQYGEVSWKRPANLLPGYLRQFMLGFAPEWFDSEFKLQTNHFLQIQDQLGFGPNVGGERGPDGKPRPPDKPVPGFTSREWAALTRAQRQTELRKWAENQARGMAYWRGFASMFGFASPRVKYPTDELREEQERLTKEMGYIEGLEEFRRLHPDLPLLTMSLTVWNEENPSPVSIPANRDVQRFLTSKEARPFVEQHSQWAWAIIPHELREGKFDAGVFFEQIADELRKVRSPLDLQEESDRQLGWDAYFAEQERWTAWQEAHQSLAESDVAFKHEKEEHDQVVAQIGQWYPAFAADLATFERQNVNPRILAEARVLAADSLFSQTETGKWLGEYLPLYDEIHDELSERNLSTIRAPSAAGLRERYEQRVAELNAEFPDGRIAYQAFFAGALQAVPTKGEKLLAALPEAAVQRIGEWEVEENARRQAISQAATDLERQQAFVSLRQWVNEAYRTFPQDQNPMLLNWETFTPPQKLNYVLSLTTRPYLFLSRFDREHADLVGDRSSPEAETIWDEVNAARVQIAEYVGQNPDVDASALYDQLNGYVAAQAASNKVFAEQVAHANTWGYVAERTLPHLFGSTNGADPYWTAFLDALRKVQAVAEGHELHGDRDPDYAALRGQLLAYVDLLKDSSPMFARQWDYLEAETSTPLLSSLMPEVWYPLGEVES